MTAWEDGTTGVYQTRVRRKCLFCPKEQVTAEMGSRFGQGDVAYRGWEDE